MNEILDLTSFENVLKSLDEVINVYNADKTNLITRDSMIQRFEYTYSISLKMLKRYIEMNALIPENTETLTFNSLIRQANKMGLLKSNLEKWDDYRQKRNLTSHTYNEDAALEVVSIIEGFASEARFLMEKLAKRD